MIRRVETPQAYLHWLRDAMPGDRCVYHVGLHAAYSDTAEEARKSGRRVFLCQRRRTGEEHKLFDYLAVRISPETADILDALQESLRDERTGAA